MAKTSDRLSPSGGLEYSNIRIQLYLHTLPIFGHLVAAKQNPQNKGGRPRSTTPVMLEALSNYLVVNPYLYYDEMELIL
jgi:hypothetical protein